MRKQLFIISLVGVGILIGSIHEHVPASLYSPFDETVTVTFVGDIMLDRYVGRYAKINGYENIARGFDELFSETDILVGNLEGPVTSYPSVSETAPIGSPNNTRFTFPPESISFLEKNNFGVVSIGNNHIADFGRSGALQTNHHLSKAGIVALGDPYKEPHRVTMINNGVSISFFSYNQFFGWDDARVVSEIKSAREVSDWIIVLAHWGEEYEPLPTRSQRERGRRFIDAGADVVVGTHPHVIQPTEEYKGGLIAYSLGNFVFDQYWNDEVRCGHVLTLSFTKDAFEATSTSAYLKKDGTTTHASCAP